MKKLSSNKSVDPQTSHACTELTRTNKPHKTAKDSSEKNSLSDRYDAQNGFYITVIVQELCES